MSPILKETDPTESGPVNISKNINGVANVCGQETDHEQKINKRKSNTPATSGTQEKDSKDRVGSIRRRSLGNFVSGRLSLLKDQKELHFDPELDQMSKKESPLKRSQSLRLKTKSSTLNSSKTSEAKNSPSHTPNNKTTFTKSSELSVEKSSKPFIKSITSRFSRFSRGTNSLDILEYDRSPSNLRRTQSMRFTSKKSFSLTKPASDSLKSSTSSTHLDSAKDKRPTFSRSSSLHHVNFGFSLYDKSKSLKSIPKKENLESLKRNFYNKSFPNNYRDSGEFQSLSNILEDPKLDSSKESLSPSTKSIKSPSSKSFSYKGFSVFKTKLKSPKSDVSTSPKVRSGPVEQTPKVAVSKKSLKMQSKRKKNECTESDNEIKPNKKVDQRESPERRDKIKKRNTKSILKNKAQSNVAGNKKTTEKGSSHGKLDQNNLKNENTILGINEKASPDISKEPPQVAPSLQAAEIANQNESYLRGSGLLYTLFFEDGYKVENPSFGRCLINGPPNICHLDDLAYINKDDSFERNIGEPAESPSQDMMTHSLTEMCCSGSSTAMSIAGSEHKSQSPMSLSSLHEDDPGKPRIDSPMSTAEYDDFYTSWKDFESSYFNNVYYGNENNSVRDQATSPLQTASPVNLEDEAMVFVQESADLQTNSQNSVDRRRRYSDASLERIKEGKNPKEFRYSFPVSDVHEVKYETDPDSFISLPPTLDANVQDSSKSVSNHEQNSLDLQKSPKKRIIISVRMMPKDPTKSDQDDQNEKGVAKQVTSSDEKIPLNEAEQNNPSNEVLLKPISEQKPLDLTPSQEPPLITDVKSTATPKVEEEDVVLQGAGNKNRRRKEPKVGHGRIPQKISRQNSAPILRKVADKDTKSTRKKSAPNTLNAADKFKPTIRGISPCHSDVSSSSDQSHVSNLTGPGISPRRPLRNLHAGSTDQPRSLIATINEKKRSEVAPGASRRLKADVPKPGGASRVSRSASYNKHPSTDPVKVSRPSIANGQTGRNSTSQHGATLALTEQLKKLESDLSERTSQVTSAKEETKQTIKKVEALTILVHYLTNEYDAFSTPKLKSEVDKVCNQLTQLQLCLDESCASVQRLETDTKERSDAHQKELEALREQHLQTVSLLHQRHRDEIEEINAKHDIDLRKFADEQECKREELIRCHKDEVEKIENDWHFQLDLQHERHLQALEQLNTCHAEKLREAEETWSRKEKELQEENFKVSEERDGLKRETKKLEETLLNDKDHRLQAAKRVCSSMQQEVDSLKTVIEMRNAELHKLRDQVADKDKISEELEGSREKVKALQAKTEDLQAQMEKKLEVERSLMADHKELVDALQKENSANKRLSLDNEELLWKLRQRELAMAVSLPTSTLDLVTRSSTGFARQHEGVSKCGGSSPQLYPRSSRMNVCNGSRRHPQGCSSEKPRRWSHGADHHTRVKTLPHSEEKDEDVLLESPPLSPCVKGVIEKSNSVSFILDLNDTFEPDSFLEFPPSPILKKKNNSNRAPSAATLKGSKRSFGSGVEKSISSPYIRCRKPIRESDREGSDGGEISPINGDVFHPRDERDDLRCRLSPDNSPKNGNLVSKHFRRGYSNSESSDGGEIERISPTGLAWTVPINPKNQQYKIYPNGTLSNGRYPLTRPQSLSLSLLQQHPDEDEYEEMENGDEFVEVLEIGDSLNATPLSSLLSRTPATSVSLSDSDLSQCGSRGDISSESEDSCSEEEDGTQVLSLGGTNSNKDHVVPQDGAGEAMIPTDLFTMKSATPEDMCAKDISKSHLSSVLSSDSEEPFKCLQDTLNLSWSEDVEGDLTSSSEMQEL